MFSLGFALSVRERGEEYEHISMLVHQPSRYKRFDVCMYTLLFFSSRHNIECQLRNLQRILWNVFLLNTESIKVATFFFQSLGVSIGLTFQQIVFHDGNIWTLNSAILWLSFSVCYREFRKRGRITQNTVFYWSFKVLSNSLSNYLALRVLHVVSFCSNNFFAEDFRHSNWTVSRISILNLCNFSRWMENIYRMNLRSRSDEF